MPLPTYQQSGLLSQPTQRLDFATEREAERSSTMISQQLDRLSDFAFRKAAQQAQIAGQQWAIENPVTPEMIAEAQKKGTDLSTFVPKPGTYFGESSRKILGYQLRAELESSARAKIADLTLRVDSGDITNLKQIQDELYGVINGGGKVIGGIDPEASASFRASVAVAGNALYQHAAKKINDLNTEKLKSDSIKSIENSKTNISTIIQTTLDPVQLKNKLDIEERRISDSLYTTRDPEFHEKGMAEYRKNVYDSKVAVLTTYLSSTEFDKSESSAIAAMRNNNAGKFTHLWNDLDEASKINIRTKVQQQFVEASMARQREKEIKKEEDSKTFVSTYAQWIKEKNPKKKKELEAIMVPLAPSTAELDKILKPDGDGQGDKFLFSILRDDIYNNRITSPYQLHKYVRSGGINTDQLNILQTEIQSSGKKEKSDADKRIRSYSGVGDLQSGFFDKNAAQFKKYEAITGHFEKLLNEEKTKQDALPPEKRTGINYDKLASDAINIYDDTDKKDIVKQTARTKLQKMSERKKDEYGISIDINENTSIEDLKRIKGKKKGDFFESNLFKDDELESIQKQLNTLKK